MGRSAHRPRAAGAAIGVGARFARLAVCVPPAPERPLAGHVDLRHLGEGPRRGFFNFGLRRFVVHGWSRVAR